MTEKSPATADKAPNGPSEDDLVTALGLAPEPSARLLPDAEAQPTVPLWPTAGKAYGLSKNATYDAAKRGDIPCIVVGRRKVVPTALLRRLMHLDEPTSSSAA